VARARPDQPRRQISGQPQVSSRHLYRLRLARPVSHPVRSRILSARLAAAGIRHRYEEFDDDHSDVDYRMDASLPFLYRRSSPESVHRGGRRH